MCRTISKFIFSTTGVILTIIGVTLVALAIVMLNPNTYISILDETNSYKLITDILESQTSDLSDQILEDDLTIEAVDLSEVVTKDTIIDIFNTVEIEPLLKETIDGNLKYSLEWITGIEKKLYVYFPKNSLLNNVSEEEIIDILLTNFYNSDYISGLPSCNNIDITYLEAPEATSFLNFSCFDAQVQTIIEKEIYGILPQSDFSIIGEYLDKNYPTLNEKTEVSALLTGESLNSFTQVQQDVDHIVTISKLSLLVTLALATLFIIIGAALSTKSQKISFSKHYIFVGATLLLGYILYIYVFKTIVVGVIPFDKIDLASGFAPSINNTEFIDALKLSLEILLDKVFVYILYVSLIILIPSVTYYGIIKMTMLMEKRQKLQIKLEAKIA